MFLQHMVAVTRDGGMVATVMPHGVLFRGGEERAIRAATPGTPYTRGRSFQFVVNSLAITKSSICAPSVAVGGGIDVREAACRVGESLTRVIAGAVGQGRSFPRWSVLSQRDIGAHAVAQDPTGPADGSVKVRRGGSWHTWPLYARCAYRNWNSPQTRYMWASAW